MARAFLPMDLGGNGELCLLILTCSSFQPGLSPPPAEVAAENEGHFWVGRLWLGSRAALCNR